MKNIETALLGLKCDNPKCNWTDSSIKINEYMDWFNKPCPKCGENVLTEEDLMNAQILLAAADFINSLTPEELGEFNNEISDETQKTLKESPIFKDAKGIDELKDMDKVSITFETHKEIKATIIRKTD